MIDSRAFYNFPPTEVEELQTTNQKVVSQNENLTLAVVALLVVTVMVIGHFHFKDKSGGNHLNLAKGSNPDTDEIQRRW